MWLKRLLVWLIKNLIILVLVMLIFSSISLDFPELVKSAFGDIFAYASPDAQREAVGRLAEACSLLQEGAALQIGNLCNNSGLLGSEGACNEMQKTAFMPDFSSVGALCKDYKSGKINDNEFFFNVVGGLFQNQLELPRIGALEKYRKAADYLNENRILYLIILLALTAMLYLLVGNAGLFLADLSMILFWAGLLIMLPYFSVLAYDKFSGIDTTPVLGSMFGFGDSIGLKAIVSVILLMFLRAYNEFIITCGIILLIAGVAGRLYGLISRRRIVAGETAKTPNAKKKKWIKKR